MFRKRYFFILLFICLSSLAFAQHEHHTSTASTPSAIHQKINQIPTKKSTTSEKKLSKKTFAKSIPSKGPFRTVNLVVGYKMVNFAGKIRKAIAVNDQIPAPTLHFKEGDHVTLNVYNQLDKGTAIHWHGILVPWQMDGVEGVNQRAIPPGGVFKYQFTLYQAGTYWFHAHADVQEQEGLYGAFIIDPPTPPSYQYNKDYVVVLSDWSNATAKQVLANLKKDGDYYSPRFPLQPSLMKFLHDYNKADAKERKKLMDDYKMMQQMRMSIYDISDVAYDAYLLNGHPKSHPWTATVKQGDIVRLRFIGAAGSTIYRVKIIGAMMEMVHVQGNDVQPYAIDDFQIAPGETYDVLVKIQKNQPYIIYAESLDTLGSAVGALVTKPDQIINYNTITPFPEPLPVTRLMMENMMMSGMNHGSMNMNTHASMSGGSSNMKHQMKMPSSSKDMQPTLHHNMQSMPHEKMKNQSNHSSKTKSTPVKRDMDMSKMDHSSMDMNQMSKEEESSSSTMQHPMSSTASDPNAAPMKMNAQNQNNKMPSMSHEMMKKMNSNQNAKATSTSSKKMSDMNMKMDKSMSMSHQQKTNESSTTKKSHSMNAMSQSPMQKMPGYQQQHTNMPGMKMDNDMKMDQNMSMKMPIEPTIVGDTIAPPNTYHAMTMGTKYQDLMAAVKTNDPHKPVSGTISMELFGYMERFIWFINGLPEYKTKPILIEPGKRYRIIFTNNSMMRHPMHIHGHWFILRNGHAAYDPLLHTVEVAPGATAVVDFESDASGQWFFHCHHLYHMMTGMSRVFQYNTIIEVVQGERKPEKEISQEPYVNRPIVRVDEQVPINPSLVGHPMAHPMGLYKASYLDIGADPFNNAQRLTFKGLYGSDYNKLELYTEDAEIYKGTVESADIDIFYWRLISQFWAVKAGVNYLYRPTGQPYWQPGIGIEGLMPYFINTNLRGYYHEGSVKLDAQLGRDTQITNNFFIRTGIRSILATKTITEDEIGSGLNQMRYIVRPYYRLMPGINLFAEYEHEQDYGAFKRIQRNLGEPTSEDTITFGLAVLF